MNMNFDGLDDWVRTLGLRVNIGSGLQIKPWAEAASGVRRSYLRACLHGVLWIKE
jgi:hypothetical protein